MTASGTPALVTGEYLLPLPTVPGMTRGVVAVDPIAIQCGDCGLIRVRAERHGRPESLVLTMSGWGFHLHEPEPPRRCPDCYAKATAACAYRHD